MDANLIYLIDGNSFLVVYLVVFFSPPFSVTTLLRVWPNREVKCPVAKFCAFIMSRVGEISCVGSSRAELNAFCSLNTRNICANRVSGHCRECGKNEQNHAYVRVVQVTLNLRVNSSQTRICSK